MPAARTGLAFLSGIRVVEVGSLATVPFCGRLLSWLGADVIKVEAPGQEDPARRRPPYIDVLDEQHSAMFVYLNIGKRLVLLDLDAVSGRETFDKLIGTADVLVHDRTRAQATALGWGDEMLARHPDLIQCAITPFGWDGVHADWVSSDLVTNAVGGDCYMTPAGLAHDERPDGEPLKLPGFAASYLCGTTGALAILASLYARAGGFGGDLIDVSEQDVHVSMSREQIMWAANENVIETRDTRAMPVGGCFECADGYVQIYVFSDPHWLALRAVMGEPEWALDEQYTTPRGRAEDSKRLNGMIRDWVRTQKKGELYGRARELGATVAPYLSPEEVLTQPQSLSRNGFTAILGEEHPALAPSALFRASKTPGRWGDGGLQAGSETVEVLNELGLDHDSIDMFRRLGII
jgi:crotonobetainyl-CoA:carnitine CoA-transferase CaiB-like acyl-CoA transferase